MSADHIELNAAYPVNVGWRHISVTEISDDYLGIRLIGIAGEEVTDRLSLGGELTLDGVVYRLISIHHRAPDEVLCRRHVAGILSVNS